MVTVPTSEELVTLAESGTLANEMARRFRLNDQAQIRLVEEQCVALHNDGTIDLLQLTENEVLQKLNGHDFFMATHVFCQILPDLEATPARMMACVEALVTHGGDDLAANRPNAAFRSWCSKDTRRARDIIAMVHDGDDLASRHLAFALEAINAVTEARSIALTYNDARRHSAITALGRMEDGDSSSRAETLATLSKLLNVGADDNLRANALLCTAATLAQSSDTTPPETVDLVRKLLEDAGEFTLHQAAHILWVYHKALQSDIIEYLLDALGNLNVANKGTVNELDLGLQSLIENGFDKEAIAYVTQLLSKSDNDLELQELGSFTRSLLTGPSERLSRVVVQWLLLGTPRICEALSEAMSGNALVEPSLNLRVEDLAISPAAQLFICRKAIGWFFLNPKIAASVLVSVLRICDAEIAMEVQSLLVEHLLVNYSNVGKYLEELSPDDTAKERVDQCLEQNAAYVDAFREIPLIKELQPSEHHRRIEHLRMSDQMRDAYKQAQSQSVLLGLMKHSVLLYGNRSLSFIKGDKDELRPMEMDLKPHEFSFEMPRMEIVDPVGLDYILRVFRRERMIS